MNALYSDLSLASERSSPYRGLGQRMYDEGRMQQNHLHEGKKARKVRKLKVLNIGCYVTIQTSKENGTLETSEDDTAGGTCKDDDVVEASEDALLKYWMLILSTTIFWKVSASNILIGTFSDISTSSYSLKVSFALSLMRFQASRYLPRFV
ncbi:hypothetical protein Scep_029358 [Stephania cephalantha]|uniref:Uncharacterized protein n=1 Tax=Stephania cephalantha TaxID=152367 RepID=A0AAP0HFI9_9MAGN